MSNFNDLNTPNRAMLEIKRRKKAIQRLSERKFLDAKRLELIHKLKLSQEKLSEKLKDYVTYSNEINGLEQEVDKNLKDLKHYDKWVLYFFES